MLGLCSPAIVRPLHHGSEGAAAMQSGVNLVIMMANRSSPLGSLWSLVRLGPTSLRRLTQYYPSEPSPDAYVMYP